MKFTPKLLFLLFLIIGSKLANADTFIVTSNADSGPGSLREAIQLANNNGVSSIDYIHFNIADITEAGRTITLQSYLPALSSNLVIDASTQPGAFFGVSEAKVKITTNGSESYSQCFILKNVSGIELYGFYITEFRFGDPNVYVSRCAIWMDGLVKNVKIGAPGKGNVFYNNGLAICTPYGYSSNEGHHFSDIDIKSNFFNLDVDGITYTTYNAWNCIIISSFTNINIGGDNISDGNYFAGLNGDAAVLYSDNDTGNGILNVKNNTFGSTFDKSASVPCGAFNVAGYEFYSLPGGQVYSDLVINIIDNTFRNPAVQFSNYCHQMISIAFVYGFITITGNTIGTPLGIYPECQTSGVYIAKCQDGIIGGDDPKDQNIIASNNYAGLTLNDNRNILIKKNSIFCNLKGIEAKSSVVVIPEVKILTTNNIDFIAGTATPNCTIEVFQNIKQCYQCNNGEVYIGKTTSDGAGNWSFTASFNGPITARATSASGVTGEFSAAKLVESNDYQDPVCGKDNGYIKGTQLVSGTRYYWLRNYNEHLDTIFNTLDLIDVGPGDYTFVVEQTKYCAITYFVKLNDLSPQISDQYHYINNPSCGQPNGSILNLTSTGLYDKIYWISDKGDTSGTSLDLTNVFEGKYKLVVLNQAFGCGDSTSYYTLVNQSGATLVDTDLLIQSVSCNNATGSISGMNVKNSIGSINVFWLDSMNNIVSTDFDLKNQPAGKYRLKYKDAGGCDTITTPYFVIPSIGVISIDTSGKKVVPAGCTIQNGMIANLSIIGAESWQWKNIDDNSIVGDSPNALLLKPGNYQLLATNHYGCSASSPAITVPAASFANVSPTNVVASNAACGQNNGMIKIDGLTNENAVKTYGWINGETGASLGSTLSISGLGEGNYKLNVIDTNGCVKTIYNVDISVNAKPQINMDNVSVINDKCELGGASINGIQVNGLANAASYTWTNADGTVVGSSLNINNLEEGSYQLTVQDGPFCTIIGNIISITNDNSSPTPQYDDLIIPRNTATTLKVNNFLNGKYYLYANPSITQLLEENTTGTFNTSVLTNDQILYVQYMNGNCISPIKPVKIAVVDKSEFAIPSAFTPNKDGLNDILHVKVIGYIKLEYFRVFNRFGQEVFFTNNLTAGWDGKVNGTEQPSGIFVWMALGKDLLGNIVQSKGTVMLIK